MLGARVLYINNKSGTKNGVGTTLSFGTIDMVDNAMGSNDIF